MATTIDFALLDDDGAEVVYEADVSRDGEVLRARSAAGSMAPRAFVALVDAAGRWDELLTLAAERRAEDRAAEIENRAFDDARDA